MSYNPYRSGELYPSDDPYRSTEPADEFRRRRRIRKLGIILLLGFLLPVLSPRTFEGGVRTTFLNFEILGESSAPGLARFMFLYPGLAGIAVIILAAYRGAARSVGLICVGILPLVVLALDPDVQEAASVLSSFPGARSIWAAVFSLAGCGGILAGIRALHYRPGSRPAAVIGAVGGGLYLVSLFLPVLPKEMGRIAFLVSFKVFGQPSSIPLGLGMLGQMVCLMLASVICLMTLARMPAARELADGAFKFVIWSAVVYLLGVILQTLFTMDGPASHFLCFLSVMVKVTFWVVGLFLLLPVGLADLIVNLTPAVRDKD